MTSMAMLNLLEASTAPVELMSTCPLSRSLPYHRCTRPNDDECPGQDQEKFIGTLDRWHTKNEVVMIKWEGWDRNRQCVLSTLDKDTDGISIDLELLSYEDGRPPPTLQELAAAGGIADDMEVNSNNEQCETPVADICMLS
ncbi:hypothetical protein AB1Y20_011620 [Prymnesium parvum]|uniref:Uncharacterized protein n=1 Tax=Prymnesium parvum TaxID=97485 RepID=A0AB34IJ38_PRYPA